MSERQEIQQGDVGDLADVVQPSSTITQAPAGSVTMYQSGRAITVSPDDVEHMTALGFRQESDEQALCPECGQPMGYVDGRDGAGDRWERGDGVVVCSSCYSDHTTPAPGHPLYEKNPDRFKDG